MRLWGVILLIIAVLVVIDVWQREHSLEKRLLWTVVVLVFPILGALAWYLVSRKIINL